MSAINSVYSIKSVLCKSIVLTLVLLSFQINALSKYNVDLYNAIQNGDQSKVLELIQNGADVNEAFQDGQTPLIYAISCRDYDLVYKNQDSTKLNDDTKKRIEIIKMLLNNKANVNATGWYGETALTYAARYGYKDITQLLIKSGANLNMIDGFCDGRTALIAAIDGDNSFDTDDPKNEIIQKEIVQILIKNKANVNLTSENYNPPLIRAAIRGKKEIVQMLIKAGANVNFKDKYGSTALRCTDQKEHSDIAQMLIKAGANRADAVKWTYYNYWYCGHNTSCIEKMKFLFENYSFSHISSITFQLKILDKNNVTLYKQQHTVNVDLDHEEKANCDEFYLGKQVVLTAGDFEDQDNYNIELDILSVR